MSKFEVGDRFAVVGYDQPEKYPNDPLLDGTFGTIKELPLYEGFFFLVVMDGMVENNFFFSVNPKWKG